MCAIFKMMLFVFYRDSFNTLYFFVWFYLLIWARLRWWKQKLFFFFQINSLNGKEEMHVFVPLHHIIFMQHKNILRYFRSLISSFYLKFVVSIKTVCENSPRVYSLYKRSVQLNWLDVNMKQILRQKVQENQRKKKLWKI